MLKRIARRILAEELTSYERVITDLQGRLTKLNYINDKQSKLISDIKRKLSELNEF